MGGPARDLLRVMVHDPEWRSRIAEALTDRSVLTEPERRLFDALAGAGGAPAAELIGVVEGDARGLLAVLLEEPLGAPDVDAVVEGWLNEFAGRRLKVELEQLQRTIALTPEAEQPDLLRRVATLSRELNKLKPGAWNVIRTGRSGAR